MKVLVTGAKGFIGTHVLETLRDQGLHAIAFEGDVRYPGAWGDQLPEVDVVCHLAARVWGEHLTQDYVENNVGGTATMIDAIRKFPVRKVILASSSAVYGATEVKAAHVQDRRLPETAMASPKSVYGWTKLAQEQLLALSGLPYVALRLFGVYGPGQSLTNPYAGIVGLLASSLLNDRQPILNEDGLQRRDFVSVFDVAKAFSKALYDPRWVGPVNIGSGIGTTLLDLVELLRAELGGQKPKISGVNRAGDVRDSIADIARARALGWGPTVGLPIGIAEFCEWAKHQQASVR